MRSLNEFVIKSLKLNKKRTIVTIIGIILSTALICAVSGLVTSVRQSLINEAKQENGNYHVTFVNVPSKVVKKIEEYKNVSSYFLTENIGWANLSGSKNDDKPYILIQGFDQNALKNYGLKLLSGRMPENNSEIVISETINTNARVNLKVGQKITLDVGKRVNASGEELDATVPYSKDTESINSKEKKTYTIVGVIKRPNYCIEGFSSPGYTAITLMNGVSDKASISVIYSNYKDYVKNNEELDPMAKEYKMDKFEKNINADLLRFEGAVGENAIKLLYGIASVVIAIIVVTSIFVIRNSFAISIYERNRQYGMLSSIGATSKQIRKNVLFEGFVIGIIGIPLGILLGMGAVYILLQIVNILLAGNLMEGFKFVYSVPVIPILISMAISAITIFLSCLIPAIKASRISPIEAIRGSEDIKIKAKKIKSPKIIKKLFGIGGVIADKNLKRCRKKYRTTIISLVISILIFISMSSFVSYGKKTSSMYYSSFKFNIVVRDQSEDNYKKISKLDNVDNYAYNYTKDFDIDYNKYASDKTKEIYANNMENNQITVMAYNNEYFKEYIKYLGLDESNYKNTVILIDEAVKYNENKSKTLYNLFNVKEKDILTLTEKSDDNVTKKYDYKITKRTDKMPIGLEGEHITGGVILVSQDYVSNINEYQLGCMYITTDKSTEVENTLNDLVKNKDAYSSMQVTNYDTYVKEMNNMVLVIEIFLYGFISVITLIGVTNIFNTITTNMVLRSKEFAMLKSIGMTSKEFSKMIRLESILYGLKSLIIGIPLGLVGSYFIYSSFAKELDAGFIFPTGAITISIVAVFLIVGLTMRYSMKILNKQNIIETIRQENV